MILLELDGLQFILLMILFIMFGPPLLFLVLGLSSRKSKPDRAKIFYIIAAVYLVIAGGICGAMWLGLA